MPACPHKLHHPNRVMSRGRSGILQRSYYRSCSRTRHSDQYAAPTTNGTLRNCAGCRSCEVDQARARAFSASYSACVMVPAWKSSDAFAISSVGLAGFATDWM